jgi:Arc/MetJ-type ribon-helix-helix transcriptional regulator
MARSISRTEKRGRGRPRINPTSIHLSLSPVQLQKVDEWIALQDEQPSRPEAIRRLLEAALAKMPRTSTRDIKATAAKATEMASSALDQLGDKSAPAEEQSKRKRRLLKGPSEFREMRGDMPKRKR